MTRVLGLGDSFMYGSVPLDENFLQVAETVLNATEGPTEAVLGRSARLAWRQPGGMAPYHGLGLEPDVVW